MGHMAPGVGISTWAAAQLVMISNVFARGATLFDFVAYNGSKFTPGVKFAVYDCHQ